MSKQRLRKEELVELIFTLFWEAAHDRHTSSIQGIVLPLDQIREELAGRSGTPRQNSKWIYTQVRKYEERLGVRLFEKAKLDGEQEVLKVTPRLLTFVQKRHLHQAEKIRVANGVADLIERQLSRPGERTRLFLGAGTTIAHLAEVLRDRAAESGQAFEVHTHNLGVIDALSHPNSTGEPIDLHVAPGRFDPVTYTILGARPGPIPEIDFDLVVQGTSAVFAESVYIESQEELPRKAAILRELPGPKLLALTLHEFTPQEPRGMEGYGRLEDYDFVVIPQVKRPVTNQQLGMNYLLSGSSPFEAGISGWHYQILTRRRVAAATSRLL